MNVAIARRELGDGLARLDRQIALPAVTLEPSGEPITGPFRLVLGYRVLGGTVEAHPAPAGIEAMNALIAVVIGHHPDPTESPDAKGVFPVTKSVFRNLRP